jgi:hypothetical protein
MTEMVGSSEKLVTTRRHIPEDSKLHETVNYNNLLNDYIY